MTVCKWLIVFWKICVDCLWYCFDMSTPWSCYMYMFIRKYLYLHVVYPTSLIVSHWHLEIRPTFIAMQSCSVLQWAVCSKGKQNKTKIGVSLIGLIRPHCVVPYPSYHLDFNVLYRYLPRGNPFVHHYCIFFPVYKSLVNLMSVSDVWSFFSG